MLRALAVKALAVAAVLAAIWTLPTGWSALAVVFLAALTYGLIEAPTLGWSSPAVVACLVVAVVAAPAFLVVEHSRGSTNRSLNIEHAKPPN